jgi:thiol:disulfide interchange protein DsbG
LRPINKEDTRLNRRRFALAAAAAAAAFTLAACQDKPAAEASATAASAPSAAPAAKQSAQEIYELAAKNGTGFTVGPMMAANTVYVFFDPACPHCAHLWQESKPLAGKLKIVWMPVQLLRSTSGAVGATILTASDPAVAMETNEASVAARGPGLAPAASLPEDVLAKVKANTDLFTKAGAESVPFILFKNGKSGQYGTHAGAVGPDELAAMVGL